MESPPGALALKDLELRETWALSRPCICQLPSPQFSQQYPNH